jgi:hypothetical protein
MTSGKETIEVFPGGHVKIIDISRKLESALKACG